MLKLLPKQQKMLEQLGGNIHLARKRRKLTQQQVAERAGISRQTLKKLEANGQVSVHILFRVLVVLNLAEQITKVAQDDPFGRTLQDQDLSR